MANFDSSFEILKKLEFSSSTNCLHKNKGEKGLTYYGIYESAHPNWQGWRTIKKVLNEMNFDLRTTSAKCYADVELTQDVKQFYITNFWRVLKCDEIKSQKLADNLFCFGVNVGIVPAIKCLQRSAGVDDDGRIGGLTLGAINKADAVSLIDRFKREQRKHYENLTVKKPDLRVFLKGWLNRVDAV